MKGRLVMNALIGQNHYTEKTTDMIHLIEKYICSKEGITSKSLHEVNEKGKLPRDRVLVGVRQKVMHYAVENKYTLSDAGKFYGLDHATVLHGKKTINNLRYSDKCFDIKMSKYDEKLLGLYKYSVKEIAVKLEMNIPERIQYLKGILLILDNDIETMKIRMDQINELRDELHGSIKLYKEKLLI